MTLALPTVRFDFPLYEKVTPKPFRFATDQADVPTSTATLKIRADVDSAVLLTLVSPTDIALGSDLSITITFTTAHFTTLLAAWLGVPLVYDLLVTPSSGTPQIGLTGTIVLSRTISR